MKIIGFAATTHKKSINQQLVKYACHFFIKQDVEILDLNDYELPLYSQDKEAEIGHPHVAKAFLAKLAGSDGIVISFAEHNGSYTSAYKNLFDWCSRIEPKVFYNKPMVLLSTSPGPRGGASVLATAIQAMPYFDGIVKASLSIPSFFDNFDTKNNRLIHPELDDQLKDAMSHLTYLK